MINKRLLIRNLLNHNDENSFYDKKLKIDLDSKEGKAKFLKHICALSNSNPENNSYIVIGVEDNSNRIVGVDFFDDSRIQDLINSCLINPPSIRYENISFPKLQRHKVVALVTILPINKLTSLKKNYWKYTTGMAFFRKGSSSSPTQTGFVLKNSNKALVEKLEKSSSNTLSLTLNGVFDFMEQHPKNLNPQYLVFKESFVLCWAGEKQKERNSIYYSRVDIELIKEQVRLFYSALDRVKIQINEESFIITEYVFLGIFDTYQYYPLEKTVIHFKDNGKYHISSLFLFESPQFDSAHLQDIYTTNNSVLEKCLSARKLSKADEKTLQNFPTTYLICSINGFHKAKEKLITASPFLKNLIDKTAYIKYKEALRVLRKIKYQNK